MVATTSTPGFTLVLPGPSRKRVPSPYNFKLAYRNPGTAEAGCVAVWEVHGGREVYQIALERTERNELRWHCCCADSIYRQDDRQTHHCKHVRGLFEVFETIGAPVLTLPRNPSN
jgi:hypothetical protein